MLKPGEIFERYTIETAIGQGGMGSVYRAHDTRLGRRVALKVISDGARGAEADARLLREARAAAALDHPNAISIFDVGEHGAGDDGATPYIVMELVSGHTLRGAIGDANVSMSTRTAWLADIARALAAAHRRGLVHRDIKPENVMVRDDGVVKVLDFGIARRAGGHADPNASTQSQALPTLTVEGVKLGTPVYMAPEQIRDAGLDGRADQFAWGVLAYELLTGSLPWRGAKDALAMVAAILTDEVDPSPLDQAAVPPAVKDVILRALAKRPDARFGSMDEVVSALEAAARGSRPPARLVPPRSAEPASPPEGAASATLAQRYSTEEVREVLARAIEQQASKRSDARLGFEDLLAAAREVGVDAETLRDASRALRNRDEPQRGELQSGAERDAWLRRKRRQFYRHAGVYLIVNLALLVLGLMVGAFPWTLIPALCWGIGLGIHGLTALTANEDDWAAENERMRWWHEHTQRRYEVAMARAGNRAQRKLGASPRQRVEAPPELHRPGVRVSMETSREQAAEEEAALAEGGERRRKRR
jgi:eukaryotic-like serine/threonine-protein kinase